MNTADIGMIGLAVMGENLVMNMESKGYTVAVYNRSVPGEEGVVDRFINGRGKGKNFIGTHTIKELIDSLSRPRKVMMMIRAGQAVDDVIEELLPYLSAGDVVIDGGNSDYKDTERRVKKMEANGIYFVGSGVSGGEVGALYGPSIMPGGAPPAWLLVKDLLQDISAKLDDGTPCCEWIGPGGAGHYVKMVHNGIEYADMQLIAEAYSLLKDGLDMDNEAMADVFEEWNKGELNSFLIDITADILRYPTEDGGYLIDKILDVAGQKGTGRWTVEDALDKGEPMTLITEAVFARMLSALPDERKKASELYTRYHRREGNRISIEEIQQALYASKLIAYAQGFSLLYRTSGIYDWQLDLGILGRIWRKGCIIRSAFLEKITEAYKHNRELENLLFDGFFQRKIEECLPGLRKVVAEGAISGLALPAMSAALTYFDGLRTRRSSANMIQAQRDYFGAHTYERIDWERGKFFHTNWTGEGHDTTAGTYNK